jgi:hypothetical protein
MRFVIRNEAEGIFVRFLLRWGMLLAAAKTPEMGNCTASNAKISSFGAPLAYKPFSQRSSLAGFL